MFLATPTEHEPGATLPFGREPILDAGPTPCLGEPRLYKHQTTRNACIATALALAAILSAAPVAAADEDPHVEDDGTAMWEDCFEVDPWAPVPSVHVSPIDCIPGY